MTPEGYKAYWVTGTDTDVGKTVVSSMLVAGLGASYWKPVQSGISDGTDTEYVKRVTRLGPGHFIPEAYRLTHPLSPHLSAALDHTEISLEAFHLPDRSLVNNRVLIMEAAGGVLVPLNGDKLVVDLIGRLEAPAVVVCRSALGTINHTLLTVRALREARIPVHGFIMNGPENRENVRAIEHYGGIPCLGLLPRLPQVDRETLLDSWTTGGFADKF